MAKTRLHVWGTVSGEQDERIKLVPSPGGGFLLFTVKNGQHADSWFETLDELTDDFAAMHIKWDDEVPRLAGARASVAGVPRRRICHTFR